MRRAKTLGLALAFSASAELSMAAPDGSLSDTNIKYIGRWDFSNSSQYSSYWCGDYIKARFTGTTVRIRVAGYNNNPSRYHVRIDNGAWTTFDNVTGTVNVTPTPLANGTHSIDIAQGKDYDYEFNFQGLVLDAGAATSAPVVAGNLIEFVGDSITAGYTNTEEAIVDYGWICAENLGCEHTQIAYPGIKLVSTTDLGMDASYFNLKTMNYAGSPAWDFARYTPKIVVINLGQNDGTGIPDATFQSTYITFLGNIRAKFPNAEIFAMRPFLGFKAAQTQAAVNARVGAGDGKVHYVDTTGWLTSSDYNDGVHPSVSGHLKAASLLQPILAPYLSGGGLANGTYKIINRNSGLALDATGQGTADGTAIEQYTYNGGTNQRWTVTSLGGGQYKIVGVQSGKALDVYGQSTADGAAIKLYTDNGGSNQKWILTATSGGYFTLQGVQSSKLMEVVGQSTAPGALVDQWTGNGGTNQQWSFQAP
jgi:hypothetical protein